MRNTFRLIPVVLVLLVAHTNADAREPAPTGAPALVDVRKIWDAAPHNAFTDLARFHDTWFCTFREGQAHVAPDGKLRVIQSADGARWESAALVSLPGADLRDPKITVAPGNRLMLLAAAARPKAGGGTTHHTVAWFSKDGKEWGEGKEVGESDFWLWRVTWHRDTAYGVGYGTAKGNESVRLYSSPDGVRYDTLVPTLADQGFPNEHGMVFLPDDTCLCLLRRDAGTKTGLLGTSRPPYKDWTWKDTGKQIGGPALLRTPEGQLLAVVRLYDGKARTSLCRLDPTTGALTEWLPLPSGGDTSYAGIVLQDGILWVSYYSSHEGKTAIYLAKVEMPQ
jgi:hypothetical protein